MRNVYPLLILGMILLAVSYGGAQKGIILSAIIDQDNLTLVFGGDVMLGRSVDTRITKYKDVRWPFLKIADYFREADVAMINLESPFGNNCKPTDSGMVFCANPKSVEGLLYAGIDVANLANNHISNQGQKGITLTAQTLRDKEIGVVGLGTPYFKTVKNTKIAFVGFNDIPPYPGGVAKATNEEVVRQVSEAKKQAELVIATFHFGNEYSRRSSRQQQLAHLAIDSGADVVIGHHPHWVQETESYKGKPIYYSLGNLVFDQMWSKETRRGLVVKLTYSGNKLISEEKLPVQILDYGQPAFE